MFGGRIETFQGRIIQFSFAELENATENFSASNLIGLGGSSYVYRGQLKDGSNVAIKRLKSHGGPEADSVFLTEVCSSRYCYISSNLCLWLIILCCNSYLDK